jgi:hypothetical protein
VIVGETEERVPSWERRHSHGRRTTPSEKFCNAQGSGSSYDPWMKIWTSKFHAY